MSCEKVVALSSKVYAKRLWCIWELFVLFSFVQIDDAIAKLEVCPLEGSVDDLASLLKKFDVSDAHCYDPNEEGKLHGVIEASGTGGRGSSEFNEKIRRFATEWYEHQGDSSLGGSDRQQAPSGK